LSLKQDTSTIEAVLNSVGTSLFQHSTQEPCPGLREDTESVACASRTSHGSFNAGSRLAQGSAADLDALSKGSRLFRAHDRPTPSDFSAKRKVVSPLIDVAHGGPRFQKVGSRELMPPPPIPNRQPYVYLARVPEPNLDEILRQNGNGEANEEQSGGFPPANNYQPYESNLTRQLSVSGDFLPAAPTGVPHNVYVTPPFFPGNAPPQVPIAAGSPPDSGWPQRGTQAHSTIYGSSSSSSTRFSSRNPPQRRFSGSQQGSLRFPLDIDGTDHVHSSGARRYGSPSSLGLSSNARSSSRLQSQSPSNPGSHRRRLGDEPSASPHFGPRDLPNGATRYPLGNRHPRPLRPIRSYDSDTPTLLGSTVPGAIHHDRNFLVEQENYKESSRGRASLASFASDTEALAGSTAPGPVHHIGSAPRRHDNRTGSDRGRSAVTGPQIPNHHQADTSRARIRTADPQASATRRRANR